LSVHHEIFQDDAKWPAELHSVFKQEGQHPLTGQRTANFRLLANQ